VNPYPANIKTPNQIPDERFVWEIPSIYASTYTSLYAPVGLLKNPPPCHYPSEKYSRH